MAKTLLKDLIYGEQIRTDGCKVNFAIGLTYSLNLEAMLTVPLAIGDIGELNDIIKQNPAYILESIRKAGDKIAVLCNKGSVHAPKEKNIVYPLLESSIFEVSYKGNKFANFHPKLWLVHETDMDGQKWLKLSVMSRNLEFSTCMDICCSMRGRISKDQSERGRKNHAPLKEMLLWLNKRYINDKTKGEKVKEVAGLLDYVDKFELDEPFQQDENDEVGYSFYPFVFGEKEFEPYGERLKEMLVGERILVISPFIDEETLSWMVKYRNKKASATLITRPEYVTQEILALFDEVWVANDAMLDNTTENIVDLHAKMYLTQRHSGEDLGYTLYLGSANATNSAFNRNAEFLLRLRYKRTTIDRINELKEEFTGDNRFIQLDTPNPTATDSHKYDEAEKPLKTAILFGYKANVEPHGKPDLYNVTLKVNGSLDDNIMKIKIRPLQCPNSARRIDSQTITFDGLTLEKLSEFYVLSVPRKNDKPLEAVIKVPTTNMPENRDECIYQSIVTNKKELLDYVAFMLSDSPAEFIFKHKMLKDRADNHEKSRKNLIAMPLYEQLLVKASTNPKQIDEIRDFIGKMKPENVPDELRQMLDTFVTIKEKLKKYERSKS